MSDRDPFSERRAGAHAQTFHVLGARLRVIADDRGLLALATHAFGGLPRQRIRARTPRLTLVLRATADAGPRSRDLPPRPRLASGAGILCHHLDAANYALVVPRLRSALVAISPAQRTRPQFGRYELLEFAVLALAARVGGLVALHAACIGRGTRCVLVLGNSGAGKSTLCLRALAAGYELLGEDSVFVEPVSLRAAGLSAFLHVLCSDRRRLRGVRGANRILASPVITRRSGARKYELDVRRSPYRIARHALRIEHVLSLTARRGRGALLRPLSRAQLTRLLARTQPYAAGQPGWIGLLRQIGRLPAWQMDRGSSPEDAVAALRTLIPPAPARRRVRG